MADEIKETFEDLTTKRCRTCAVCGKPEMMGYSSMTLRGSAMTAERYWGS